MRRTYLSVAVAGILIAAFFFSLAPAREARGVGSNAPPVWEYRILALSDVAKAEEVLKDSAKVTSAFEAKFNELGRDGWEVAIPLPGAVVFKRQNR